MNTADRSCRLAASQLLNSWPLSLSRFKVPKHREDPSSMERTSCQTDGRIRGQTRVYVHGTEKKSFAGLGSLGRAIETRGHN